MINTERLRKAVNTDPELLDEVVDVLDRCAKQEADLIKNDLLRIAKENRNSEMERLIIIYFYNRNEKI